MADDLIKKTDSLKSEIDTINQTLNGQLTELKKKMMEEINKNGVNIIKNFEDSLKKLESSDKSMQESMNELNNFKLDNDIKLSEMQHNFNIELKEIKKELSNHSIILENLENKINDNIININRDIGVLLKDVNIIKCEIESVKNFRENTVLNFKDIGNEFIKNEEMLKKMSYKINLSIRDFDTKITNFEQSFNLHNDNFSNIKKDIYSQIYETNAIVNDKLQMFNDSLNQKFESFDRIMNDFQSNLMVN